MTADELHALAVRTRDAARLAERHGTSTHGYRRAAREACERMGEMAEQLAEAEERAREYDREAAGLCRTGDDLMRDLAEMTRGRDSERARANEWLAQLHDVQRQLDESRDAERCEHSLRLRWEERTEKARDELRDLVAALGQDDGPRAAAIQHARSALEEWGMR